MNEISVSYIIPVYNGETFILDNIKRLLSSIGEQDEVIVVDDCSKDNTLEILKQIDDARLILLEHIHNQGVAGARNTGIDHASKEYLTFVDADDFLAPEYFDRIKGLLVDYQKPEILRFQRVGSGRKYEQTGLVSLDESLLTKIYGNSNLLHSCWGQLLLRRFIHDNNFKFTQDIQFGEDMLFTFSLLQKSENTVLLNEEFYVYNMIEGSLSNTLNYSKVVNRIKNINLVYQEMMDLVQSDDLRTVFSIKFKREVSNQSLKLFQVDRKRFMLEREEILKYFTFDTLMDTPVENVYDRFYEKMIQNKGMAISLFGNSYTLIKKIKR